jgi:hypothetical protein
MSDNTAIAVCVIALLVLLGFIRWMDYKEDRAAERGGE